MITTDDYCWFVDRALDQMVTIVVELGDDGANRTPELPGANSAFAILTHALGVVSWWGGRIVGGREVVRNRDAEFTATGAVEELAARVQAVLEQFHIDVADAVPTEPPRVAVSSDDADLPLGRTQGGALLHVYEEISQHLGQLELTRDVVAGSGVAK